MNDRTPELGRPAFICPHCKAHAQQSWFKIGYAGESADQFRAWDTEGVRARYEEIKKSKSEADLSLAGSFESLLKALDSGAPGMSSEEGEYMRPLWNLAISQCFACESETLWLGGRVIFPSRSIDAPAPNPDMPGHVAEDYEEAARIVSSSPRSAAALLRLSIQKLCSHLLDRKGDINEKLALL